MSRSGSGAGSAADSTLHGLQGRSLASLNARPEGSMRAAAAAAAQARALGAAAGPAEPFLQPERRPSTLQLLSSAARAYFEGSSHGGRSQRGSAAAATATSGSSHGGGAARQVADDSMRGLRRQQAAGLLPLGALLGGSPSSCSSASSHGLAGVAGAPAGAAGAVQFDREASEGRQRGTMVAALAAGVPHEHINAMLAMRSGSLPSSVGSPAPLPLLAGSSGSTAAGTPARTSAAPRPASIAHALEAAAPAAPMAPAAPAAGGSRAGAGLEGLRPHRVVQRRSLENPLLPCAAAGAGCCAGGRG